MELSTLLLEMSAPLTPAVLLDLAARRLGVPLSVFPVVVGFLAAAAGRMPEMGRLEDEAFEEMDELDTRSGEDAPHLRVRQVHGLATAVSSREVVELVETGPAARAGPEVDRDGTGGPPPLTLPCAPPRPVTCQGTCGRGMIVPLGTAHRPRRGDR